MFWIFFLFLLKTLIVGTRSNEYPQSMFWIENKKSRYTPVYLSFTHMKLGLVSMGQFVSS